MTNPAALHEPDPIQGKVIVLDLVKKDLEDRAIMGNEKYGTYLMTHNGRNALMDAYQECLDLAMYLRQLLFEQEELNGKNKDIIYNNKYEG